MSCPKCQPQKKRLPWTWIIAVAAIGAMAVLAYTAG